MSFYAYTPSSIPVRTASNISGIQEEARNFVQTYYGIYNGERSGLERHNLQIIYNNQSVLTIQDRLYSGQDEIMNAVCDEKLDQNRKIVTNFSSQGSVMNTLFIQVQGDTFFVNDEEEDEDQQQRLPFSESFILRYDSSTNGFVILNQIFSTQGI